MKREKLANPSELYGLLKASLKYQTKEFFSNSTLHGVRYIAEKDRSFGEKFMWFSFVSIGAVAAFVIIGSLWEKFQTNPTITGLDTDFHNQQVLFPTISICPNDPYDPELVNQTAMENEDDSGEEMAAVLKALATLSFETFENTYNAVLNMSAEQDLKRHVLRQLAFKVGMKCEDLLEICKYKDEDISCCDYFRLIYTEHGLCYAFNARYSGKPEEELRNKRFSDLFETDKKWALDFVISREAKIFVHSTDDVTSFDYRPTFYYISGNSVELLINTRTTYTTDDARQLSVGQRKCIFPDEVKPKYYKDDQYSFTGCMKECRMKKANKFCKCIPPFYMPSTGNYRQCTLDDFACLSTYRHNITDIRNCRHCELSCVNTVYDIEKFIRTPVSDVKPRAEFRIHIEFLTWPIIRYKREVLFGWVDLLVSFGGIAGLFLGFSLLSGVEIIYYFTMRTGCMMYKNRAELYAAQEEEKLLSVSQYDLGLNPKLKKSDKMKSLSMPTVKPVESAGSNKAIQVKAFDSPRVPIKKKTVGQINTIRQIESLAFANRLTRSDAKNRKRLFVPPTQNLFRPIYVAPYSQRIKPLDKRFRIRSHSEQPEVIFDGYLP